MKRLETAFLKLRTWFTNLSLGKCLILLFALYVTAVLMLLWTIGILQTAEQSATSRIGDLITDPDEIAFLDNEFGDLTAFGYSPDVIYRRTNLISDQLEPGYGPLHRVRGCELLVGKTGAVAVVYYLSESADDRSPLIPEPEDGAELCLLWLDGYTAQEDWWNRPVASAWCENGTIVGQTFPELSMWAPWPEPVSSGLENGEERSACGWYWNGTAYAKFNRFTTLVVNDGRVDFAVLSQPSSP